MPELRYDLSRSLLIFSSGLFLSGMVRVAGGLDPDLHAAMLAVVACVAVVIIALIVLTALSPVRRFQDVAAEVVQVLETKAKWEV